MNDRKPDVVTIELDWRDAHWAHDVISTRVRRDREDAAATTSPAMKRVLLRSAEQGERIALKLSDSLLRSR